ncbi:MAG: APC family permease [Anaerolineae bacterium]|nr:APC family permease [Anaerolineae bacterium]
MIWRHIRELVIGSPLPSEDLSEARLDKVRALAALSPDALASVAYANQEIFLGLVVAGAAGMAYSWRIACVIAGLLAVLTLSYSQTIRAYPSGGGSYIVARENLGTLMGLIAAAALLIDYVLNAAVSLTAGVEALASAFPVLWPYRTILSLVLLVIITLVNLRGLREAGTIMIVPVYLFLATYLGMIIYGAVVIAIQGPVPLETNAPQAVDAVTAFLVLRTFASGATALTGVEAISNAVPVFNPPEPRHARQTMVIMAALMGVLFLGTIGLTQLLAIMPGSEETILSALARRLFGPGPIYLLIQIATLLVLIVAANTSFTGFPRVAAVIAHDEFLPRQLKLLGDRLVFTNGILLLSFLAGFLIVIFGGDTHNLIPLFAVGAFLAFTLSQMGMVIHWIRQRNSHWRLKAFLNGIGALSTGLALLVIAVSKFVHGAWIVILLIPLIVTGFYSIRAHYDEIGRELTLVGTKPVFESGRKLRIVVPVTGIHRGVAAALQYARLITDDVKAVYIETEPDTSGDFKKNWQQYGLDKVAVLDIVPSPYRSFIGPLLDYLDRLDNEADDGQLASIVIPEFIPAKWWHNLLHNQTAWRLKLALMYRRHRMGKTRAIIDIPFHLKR